MSLISSALNASCVYRGGINQYVNPLDVFLGDPFVMLHEDIYYLYATSAWNGYKVWSSPDMVNWTYRQMAYTATERSYGKGNFWAPEVIYRDGTFYMHYTAQGEDGILRICVATSPSPLGPFQDVAAPMFDTGDGKAWIDGHVFLDDDGTVYFYVVKDYSRNNAKSQIFVAKMKDNLTELDEPLTLCIEPEGKGTWEGTGWTEGPWVMKRKGIYYLMYSGNFYGSSNYSVGYANSNSPLGPWTKYSGNPILKKKPREVSGPGHHSVAKSIDGSEMFICYHTHQSLAGGGARQLAIDRLVFEPDPAGGPDILKVLNGPSNTPQPYPAGAPDFSVGTSDDFSNPLLERSRWLIFGEDPDKWQIRSGRLHITTQEGDAWSTSIGQARNIFLQYAPEGNFEISTSFAFSPSANFEQAFLIVWQDHNNYLRLSSAYSDGLKFEAIWEANGAIKGYANTPNQLDSNQRLKIERRDNRFHFFYGSNDTNWTELGSGFAVDFHEIKVGLGAIAPGSNQPRTAEFDYFQLKTRIPNQ